MTASDKRRLKKWIEQTAVWYMENGTARGKKDPFENAVLDVIGDAQAVARDLGLGVTARAVVRFAKKYGASKRQKLKGGQHYGN